MNDPHIYDRHSDDFHEALDARQQRSDEINAGVSSECSSAHPEPNTQQGQTTLLSGGKGNREQRASSDAQSAASGNVVSPSQSSQSSFDNRIAEACEWFDSLPKPPEPLPWLPQEKATDRHPFE